EVLGVLLQELQALASERVLLLLEVGIDSPERRLLLGRQGSHAGGEELAALLGQGLVEFLQVDVALLELGHGGLLGAGLGGRLGGGRGHDARGEQGKGEYLLHGEFLLRFVRGVTGSSRGYYLTRGRSRGRASPGSAGGNPRRARISGPGRSQ